MVVRSASLERAATWCGRHHLRRSGQTCNGPCSRTAWARFRPAGVRVENLPRAMARCSVRARVCRPTISRMADSRIAVRRLRLDRRLARIVAASARSTLRIMQGEFLRLRVVRRLSLATGPSQYRIVRRSQQEVRCRARRAEGSVRSRLRAEIGRPRRREARRSEGRVAASVHSLLRVQVRGRR